MNSVLRALIGLVLSLLAWQPVSAEVCANVLASEASPELTAIAAEQCDTYWTANLEVSGTRVLMQVEQDIADLTKPFKDQLVVSLKDADDALRKLGPTVLNGRDAPMGRTLQMIVTSHVLEGALAWVERNGRDCFMVIDPISWRSEEGKSQIGITMAHELFHCVQEFSIDQRVLNAYSGSWDKQIHNLWWIEGSAEWFGLLAQPEDDRSGLAAAFELFTDHLALSNFERPSDPNGQRSSGQSTWPFFAWYSEKESAHQMVPFLAGLPARPHTPEMIARELSHQQWGDFATRYSAFTIWMTGIGVVDPSARSPQPLERIDVGRHTIARPVGHMIRERVQLPPGRWHLESDSNADIGQMFYSHVRGNGDPDGSWVELKSRTEVQSVCGEPLDLMIAGFGSDPQGRPFSYLVEKVDDMCEARCDAVPAERNQCIVGIWEDTNHIPRSGFGRNIVETRYPPPTYSFAADGRFTTNNPFYMHKLLDGGPPGVPYYQITHYTLDGTYGYWGSRDDSLATCEQQNVTRGEQVTGFENMRGGLPLNFDEAIDPPRETRFEFECSDDTLILRTPSMGPASMTLRRKPGQP